MERVAFLLESTGERLGAMLNPESVVLRRSAGVRARRSAGGAVTGAGLTDDPVLFTGGGTTELHFDLLFDVTLPGSSIQTEDVRQLTLPLWNLAENGPSQGDTGRPPLVRFVWGRNWNIPGIVVSVAERLEYFTSEGLPRRSWLRMRFLRTADPLPEPELRPEAPPGDEDAPAPTLLVPADEIPEDQVIVHEVNSGEASSGVEVSGGERWDLIAERYLQDCRLWKLLADFNNIDDPSSLRPGQLLRIPPASAIGGQA
jgi:nucleoid-associated protein YgaU